jgi:hypothetical protein
MQDTMNTYKVLPLFLLMVVTSCIGNRSLSYQSSIESSDGKYNYCLFTENGGIGDPGFYVLKLDKNIDPTKIQEDSFNTVEYNKAKQWTDRTQVLSNYDEISLFTSNPGIELINNRFLVMKRGGYYFGLYDLKLDTPIVNVASPATEYHYPHPRNEPRDAAKEKEAYEKYIQENLDGKIKEYIQLNSLKK